MMHNFIAYFWKGGNFLESNRAKWPRKQAFFHCRTVKGTESNNFKCKGRSMYSLIHEQWKRQIPKFSRANCVTIQLTVRAWSHEPGKQCAWTECYQLSCSHLVHSLGRPASMITWKVSIRDPGIIILVSQLTGLARLSYNRNVYFCWA